MIFHFTCPDCFFPLPISAGFRLAQLSSALRPAHRRWAFHFLEFGPSKCHIPNENGLNKSISQHCAHKNGEVFNMPALGQEEEEKLLSKFSRNSPAMKYVNYSDIFLSCLMSKKREAHSVEGARPRHISSSAAAEHRSCERPSGVRRASALNMAENPGRSLAAPRQTNVRGRGRLAARCALCAALEQRIRRRSPTKRERNNATPAARQKSRSIRPRPQR